MHADYQRRIPRLEDSFTDCSYLFLKFKEHLKSTGHAAIVALNFINPGPAQDMTGKNVALFIRMMDKLLTGRIEGGYRASDSEFFLLLVPTSNYCEARFQQDLEIIRRELRRYFTVPHMYGKAFYSTSPVDHLYRIDGVFLTNHDGEKADNALFRAFQELFSASASQGAHQSPERREIEEIICKGLITPVYQPIISFKDGSIYGYEALSRVSRPSPLANPELLFANHFTPFYVGRHYGGLYLLLPQPGSWNLHTFTLSVLGNLSDKSFVGRVDWSVTLLTYLTFEAYLAGHFGANGGEFRLGIDVPSRLLALDPVRCAQIGGAAAGAATCATPALQRGAPIADAGVAVRVSL